MPKCTYSLFVNIFILKLTNISKCGFPICQSVFTYNIILDFVVYVNMMRVHSHIKLLYRTDKEVLKTFTKTRFTFNVFKSILSYDELPIAIFCNTEAYSRQKKESRRSLFNNQLLNTLWQQSGVSKHGKCSILIKIAISALWIIHRSA